MTNDIRERMFEHKTKVFKNAFTKRYNCDHLMYYEEHETRQAALDREQVIKRLHRVYKKQLIYSMNPQWIDLSKDWFEVCGKQIFLKGSTRK